MLHHLDSVRLDRAIALSAELCRGCSFTRFAPASADPELTAETAARVHFDHVAAFVLPDSHDDVSAALAAAGFAVRGPIPSVAVRARLADRYGVAPEKLDVRIVQGSRTAPTGERYGVEVFSLERAHAEGAVPGLPDDEQAKDEEAHVAFRLSPRKRAEFESLRALCRDAFALRPDGSAYNPFENTDSEGDGRTILYFAADHLRGAPDFPHRLELFAPGHLAESARRHDQDTAPGAEETRLLSLLSGHWAARAVHVAAELGIADELRDGPRGAAEVASRLGADADATGRLLGYLAHLGVVRKAGGDRFAPTALGSLLGSDSAFRDLALIYGGEFYDAWSEFGSSVRTGGTGFRAHFGAEHFDHFAAHPASARRFDRAMQAVTHLVADELPRVFAFPAGSTVVDVGGGNGTLLRAVLRENPDVFGIVCDREHVAGALPAEPRLGSVAADFFEEVPAGGDFYLLSRVLHDWSDEDCLRILRSCRRACAQGGKLLVLERLLPDRAGEDSLAAAWDMQMLAVTGGRERHRHTYEELLERAGFRLETTHPLPVHMNLLVATASA